MDKMVDFVGYKNIVSYKTTRDKSRLSGRNNRIKNRFYTISKGFSTNLINYITQADGTKLRDPFRPGKFRGKNNKTVV